MKTNIILFFSLIFSLSGFAQYNPAVIGLKTGDSITGIIGDVQRKVFKYKTQLNGKAKKIDFAEIEYVTIRYSGKDIKTYRFFQLDNDKKYTPVEQLAKGKNAELYAVTQYMNSSGAAGPPLRMEILTYYIKRPTEEKLTLLGGFDPLSNHLKDKIITYVSDCPDLSYKIENKEFRMRNGLKPIIEFYNTNCNSLIPG